jgi:hypothetical protein
MWKEKYETLAAQIRAALGYPEQFRPPAEELPGHIRTIRESYDAAVTNPAARNGHAAVSTPSDLEAIYAFVKAKAMQDGEMIHLLRMTPEIRVNVKRHTLEMSDDSTDGRIALLISQKFFDSPQDSGTLTKEFKRRGWFEAKTSNAAVLKPLAKITEMGFLVREGTMYQSVPGMKINIVEA